MEQQQQCRSVGDCDRFAGIRIVFARGVKTIIDL